MINKSILENCLILMMGASFFAWCISFRKLAQRKPLVAVAERSPVPWNAFDVLLSMVFFIVIQLIAMLMVRQSLGIGGDEKPEDFSPHQIAVQLMVGALGQTLAAMAIWAYIRWARGAKPADFGLGSRGILTDLGLGFVGFFQLIGPVLLIQGILTHWWPSKHPIIELLNKSESRFAWIACTIAAVIVAPLVEEFLFRVVLQGWFERIAVMGFAAPKEVVTPTQESFQSGLEAPSVGTVPSNNTIPLWPVFASAAIFALMHAGHGPDMVALFIFACGLGYLYRQTHRVLPCIVVHFLLNAWSMIALLSLVRSD